MRFIFFSGRALVALASINGRAVGLPRRDFLESFNEELLATNPTGRVSVGFWGRCHPTILSTCLARWGEERGLADEFGKGFSALAAGGS